MGVYLRNNFDQDGPIYHRMSYRYYVGERLFIDGGFKSHWAVAENFEVGVLFKSKDSSDFKIKVKNLYKNNELRLKMKRNCLQAIENHLNSDLISKNLVKYYDQ